MGQPIRQDVADQRLANGTSEDAERGDADLDRRDHADGVVHEPQGCRDTSALPGLDRRPTGGDHRVFADDEEGVRTDEREHREDAQQVDHVSERSPPNHVFPAAKYGGPDRADSVRCGRVRALLLARWLTAI